MSVKLCSRAEQALYANATFQEAVDWCLSSATAANLPGAPPAAAGGGGGGSAAAAGPPQKPLPAQPPAAQQQAPPRATQRVKADERLQKEWVEQHLSNKESNAMVFAEPLGSAQDSPGGLRDWVGVVLGPDTSVYAEHAFQVYIHT